MSAALNCNRCNRFVSLASPKDMEPGKPSPVAAASGWEQLRLTRPGDWAVNDGVDGAYREHLCPDCIVDLKRFMDNEPVEPAKVHLDCKIDFSMWENLFEPLCVPYVSFSGVVNRKKK